MMFASTRCCHNLARSALVASNAAFLVQSQGDKLVRPLLCQAILQRRYKHDKHENDGTIFENIFEKPIDHSRVYFDEALKGLGARGIKRDGNRVNFEDSFKLFGLQRKLLINEGKLHREMIKLQRAMHPDKYLRADKTSREASDQLSAMINEAYETLKHPYKRALYLIRLQEGKSESEVEKSLDNLEMDPEFLARTMELREKIESGHGDPGQQMKLAQLLQAELDEIVMDVNRDLEINDFNSALKKLGKLKFLANCHIATDDEVSLHHHHDVPGQTPSSSQMPQTPQPPSLPYPPAPYPGASNLPPTSYNPSLPFSQPPSMPAPCGGSGGGPAVSPGYGTLAPSQISPIRHLFRPAW